MSFLEQKRALNERVITLLQHIHEALKQNPTFEKRDALIAESKKMIESLKAFNQRAITSGLVLHTATLESAYQGINPAGSSKFLFDCLGEIKAASGDLSMQDPFNWKLWRTRSQLIEDGLKLVAYGFAMITSSLLLGLGVISLPVFSVTLMALGSLVLVDALFLDLHLPDFIMCPVLYGEMPSLNGELDYASLKGLTLFDEAPVELEQVEEAAELSASV